MRNVYRPSRFNSLDQGSIFNGAIARGYQSRVVLGIIITPRCDIEHSKVSEINYLPIISVHDWLSVDGRIILQEKCRVENNQKLMSEFKKHGVSESLLQRNTNSELINFFKSKGDDAKFRKILDLLSRRDVIAKMENNLIKSEDVRSFFAAEEKHVRGIVKDLSDNRFKEFYLLDPIDSNLIDLPNDYWVVLNRQIQKIEFDKAIRISGGLELIEIIEANKELNQLDFECPDGIILCLNVLKSPFIEHLMQVFLSNFNRIGVVDHSSTTHEDIIKNIHYDQIFVC